MDPVLATKRLATVKSMPSGFESKKFKWCYFSTAKKENVVQEQCHHSTERVHCTCIKSSSISVIFTYGIDLTRNQFHDLNHSRPFETES